MFLGGRNAVKASIIGGTIQRIVSFPTPVPVQIDEKDFKWTLPLN
jgi:hypothetical protein